MSCNVILLMIGGKCGVGILHRSAVDLCFKAVRRSLYIIMLLKQDLLGLNTYWNILQNKSFDIYIYRHKMHIELPKMLAKVSNTKLELFKSSKITNQLYFNYRFQIFLYTTKNYVSIHYRYNGTLRWCKYWLRSDKRLIIATW